MLNQQMYISGPGAVIWTQATAFDGSIIANPSPAMLGVLQDHAIDEKKDTKKLYGEKNRPVAIMGGKMDSSVDVKCGALDLILLNSIYYGQTVTTGTVTGFVIDATTGTAIPATPFQITPAVPNSGTWARDLGVINAANNKRMVRVASAPAAGQYSVAAGVYTFSSADNVSAIKVLINFEYIASLADATTATFLSAPIGPVVSGTLDVIERSSTGSYRKITYTNVICSNYKAPAKQDDFMIHELKFEPFASANGSFIIVSELNI